MTLDLSGLHNVKKFGKIERGLLLSDIQLKGIVLLSIPKRILFCRLINVSSFSSHAKRIFLPHTFSIYFHMFPTESKSCLQASQAQAYFS
jgi:hypothetical protein